MSDHNHWSPPPDLGACHVDTATHNLDCGPMHHQPEPPASEPTPLVEVRYDPLAAEFNPLDPTNLASPIWSTALDPAVTGTRNPQRQAAHARAAQHERQLTRRDRVEMALLAFFVLMLVAGFVAVLVSP